MAKNKGLSMSIPSDNVMYTNISKSKDGYNSARVVAKMGEKEYMSVSYEWEGEGVPAFAMDLMGFMQANNVSANTIVAGFEEDEYACKTCKKHNPDKKKKSKKVMDDEKAAKDGTKKVPADTNKKKMAKVCEECGNPTEDCTCGGKKQMKKTKEKKGNDKKA